MLRIYKSSAGSGKTYTLVREFIRIALKNPDKFRHILAITFTNKAANEMKQRIIQTLEQLRGGEPVQLIDELIAETGLSEREIIEKANFILRNILHNYSDVSVSTIDSFVHRVIRSFTYDLHLSMNFEVEMDRDKLLNEAVEKLMDRLGEEDGLITSAVVEFAESNINEGKSWNLEFSLVQLAYELFVEDAYQHIDKFSDFDLTKGREVRENLYAYINSFEQKLFEEGKKAIALIERAGLNEKHFYYSGKGIYGFFQKYANKEFPNDDKGNSYVQTTIESNKWVGGKVSESDASAVNGIRIGLIAHYNNIVSLFDKQGQEYQLAKLLIQNFYSFILLADIQKLMNEYKKENNILHISEFQERVHAIVREQDAPVIYERIGDWYDNILIDEHQDTSVLQWQNLLPLVENSQFKIEDSLVVGDGKQAIYRFRNGKVEQFVVLPKVYGSDDDMRLKEREVAITNYGTEVKKLGANYRSRKEIVGFNNLFYEVLSDFPELRNKDIYEGQAQEQGRKADGGFVSIEFLKDSEELILEEQRNLRAEDIIRDVRSRGYNLKDIAVLTRSNKNGSQIASYLIEKGYPVVSSESLLIANSPKVKLILSTLAYFEQRENHIARAEMVYYIHLLLLQKEFRFEQFDFKCEEQVFEEMISSVTGKPFFSYNFLSFQLVSLLQELINFYGWADNDPFLQFFLDEAMVYVARNRSNIREFLLWWEEKKNSKSIIYPESLDAVKIMTLHKSKGLQFPVVIMADADWPQRNSKRNFWVDIDKPWLKDLRVGILPARKEMLKTEYAHLFEEEEASSFLDMLNLLYVGTTRAEDMLYVLSTDIERDPIKKNSITALLTEFLKQQDLWDGFKRYEFGDADTVKVMKKPRLEEAVYKRGEGSIVTSSKPVSIRKNSRMLWNEEKVEKIDKGNLLHEILKKVKYPDDAEKVLVKMKNEGLVDEEGKQQLLKEVNDVISLELIRKYFNMPYKVINERPLMSKEYTKTPDRVVLNGKELVVLEYKTGDKRSEHKAQLKGYMKTLATMGYSDIKGFLVYCQDNSVEQV